MEKAEKLTKGQVSNWLKHPVTQRLLQTLKAHKIADQEAIVDITTQSSPNDIEKSVPFIIQLKGQINTVEAILEIKEFLLTDEEINANEISGLGAESPSESEEI